VDHARNPVLSGSLGRAIWHVAVPAAAIQILVFLNNVVDYYWIQKLGEEAAAGQTQGWTIFWMLASIGQIFSTGTTAIVARRVGEGRLDAASSAATHAVRGALMGAVVVAIAGYFLVPFVAENNASSARAGRYTLDYLETLCIGAPFIFFFYVFEGTFKGRGDMRRPLRAVATSVGLNMFLDPLFIFTFGLEVRGAALATVVAFGFTGSILAVTAWRRQWITRARGVDFGLVRRVVRIGTPVSIHGIVFSFVYIFIVREVNLAGGDPAAAALGLGLRVEGLAFLVGVGFAIAAATVVGQNLGANRIDRAHRGAWMAVRYAMYFSGAWGLFLLVVPASAVAWVSPGALAAHYATHYFHIVAISLAFTAVEIVLEGAFSGAGDTLPPMLLGIPFTLLRIPAAMIASRGLGYGVAGIFWALTLTSVIRGLLFAFWFARGKWIHAKA